MPRSVPRVRRSVGPSIGGDFRVTGAEDLQALARGLRQAGDKDLRKELMRGLRSGVKPLIADTREHARQTLPKRGGLNERVARSKFKVKIRTGANPSVRITATGLDARLDRTGRDRHPVFGNREVWVQQKVTPGWFSVPMKHGARRVRKDLLDVMDSVARKL